METGERAPLTADDLTPLEIAMCLIARQRQLLDHSDPVGFSPALAQTRLNEAIKAFGERFHVPVEPEWFCPVCLGPNVECEVWVDATTNKYVSDSGSSENWCSDCNMHVRGLFDRATKDKTVPLTEAELQKARKD